MGWIGQRLYVRRIIGKSIQHYEGKESRHGCWKETEIRHASSASRTYRHEENIFCELHRSKCLADGYIIYTYEMRNPLLIIYIDPFAYRYVEHFIGNQNIYLTFYWLN